jgi:hypothetical protein
MLNTPSLKSDPSRLFRATIMNGVTPPATVVAQLEARGVNVGELEQRLRQAMEFVR